MISITVPTVYISILMNYCNIFNAFSYEKFWKYIFKILATDQTEEPLEGLT